MFSRSTKITVGAFLVAASLFFSLGHLSSHYGGTSGIIESHMPSKWRAPEQPPIDDAPDFYSGDPNDGLVATPEEEKLLSTLSELVLSKMAELYGDAAHSPHVEEAHDNVAANCREEDLDAMKGVFEESTDTRLSFLSSKLAVDVIKRIQDTFNSQQPENCVEYTISKQNRENAVKKKQEKPFKMSIMEKYAAGNKASRSKHVEVPLDQKDLGPRPDEILIFTATDAPIVGDGNAKRIRQALENRDEYAAFHGYKHVFLNLSRYEAASVEHPCWLKLPAIQETLHRYPEVKWLWWLDVDAIIMNGRLKLEEHLLHPYSIRERMAYDMNVCDAGDIFATGSITPPASDFDPDKIELLFTHDYLTLNAGSFFMKNTPANRLMLDLWGDPEFIYNKYGGQKFERREQDAFIRMYMNHASIRDRTGIYYQSAMNSYNMTDYESPVDSSDPRDHRIDQSGSNGDFVIHFAGYSTKNTYGAMWNYSWDRRIRPNGDPASPEEPQHD